MTTPETLTPLQNACAVGTELEPYFDIRIPAAIEYPSLGDGQVVVCDYLDWTHSQPAPKDMETSHAVVRTVEQMQTWVNAFKFLETTVVRWRIVEEDSLTTQA